MNRTELDAFAARHRLPADAIAAALALTRNRPDAADWRAFGLRLLNGLGLLGLAAGAIFFVAANWQDYGVFGRFAILEAALVASVGVALWRPPPARTGQSALMLATLLTGALLALFGQSYQTGADVHELFFGWAALALPFVLAAQWGAVWAAWLCIANIGLVLYFGVVGGFGRELWLDAWWGGPGGREPVAAMLVALVDFALAGLGLVVARTRFAPAAPRWLLRFAGTLAFGFGTWACLLAVLQGDGFNAGNAAQRLGVLAAFVALSAATLAGTLRRRADVFPIALLAAAWIAISTAYVGELMPGNASRFFVVASWLLALAAAAGASLMRLLRAWQLDAPVERSTR
jgi:hypothetical protein